MGKTLCQETSTALDTWLVYANKYFHMIPNNPQSQELGFLMLDGPMVKVAIMREIRNDFGAADVRTDTALNSYTDEEITITTVAILYNQYCLNLEVLKQVY